MLARFFVDDDGKDAYITGFDRMNTQVWTVETGPVYPRELR